MTGLLRNEKFFGPKNAKVRNFRIWSLDFSKFYVMMTERDSIFQDNFHETQIILLWALTPYTIHSS